MNSITTLLVALTALFLPQVDQAAVARAELDRVYAEYVRQPEHRDVRTLVELDARVRAVVPPRDEPWSARPALELEPTDHDRALGINSLLFDPGYAVYSGWLLEEAHGVDPQAMRASTLYSEVWAKEGEDGWGPPSALAANQYLDEFPNGPFSSAAHLDLATYYQDLYQALAEFGLPGDVDPHAACFLEDRDQRPLAVQRREALGRARAHWQELIRRYPGSRRIVQDLNDLQVERGDGWRRWHYCAD